MDISIDLLMNLFAQLEVAVASMPSQLDQPAGEKGKFASSGTLVELDHHVQTGGESVPCETEVC